MKSSYEGISWYYEKFPEYTIEFYDDPENEDLRTPPFALMHTNARSSWHILRGKVSSNDTFRIFSTLY